MRSDELLRIAETKRDCILRSKELNCNTGQCVGCNLVIPDNVWLNACESLISILKIEDDDIK